MFCQHKYLFIFSFCWLAVNPFVYSQWSTDPSENTRIDYGGQNPQITSDGNGGAIIVSIGYGGWEELLNVYVHRINESGALQWGPIGIRASIGSATSQSFPNMTADSSCNAIVQFRGSYWNGTTTIFQLIIQKISPTGDRLWGDEGIIVSDQISGQMFPHKNKMVIGENNGVYVGWFGDRPNNAISYVRYFDSTGTASPNWNENTFRGVTLLDGDIVGGVVFRYSIKTDQDSLFSYVQRLNYNAQTFWDSSGVLFSSRVYNGDQVGASDRNGGVIITWYEIGLGSGYGVFAQPVSRDGNLGEVILAIPHPDPVLPGTFALFPNFPNPFNQGTNIQYYLPRKNHIVLNIYSLNGQKVITLVDEYKNSRKHQVFGDGKNEFGINAASGVYLVNYIAGDKSTSQKISMLK